MRDAFASLHPEVRYAVSATTRPPRPGEREAQSYFFLDEAEFLAGVDAGDFVEHSRVYGHLYGTPRQPMEGWLAGGQDVMVEKDIQGAAKLRPRYPDAVFVFILPPSLEELRERITRRGTESAASRAQRLRSASLELSHLCEYDYAIVNRDVQEAAGCLEAIWRAEKLRTRRQPDLVDSLLGPSARSAEPGGGRG